MPTGISFPVLTTRILSGPAWCWTYPASRAKSGAVCGIRRPITAGNRNDLFRTGFFRLFVFLLYGCSSLGGGETSSDFLLTEKNGSLTISGYLGDGGAVFIPRQFYDIPVTAIGAYAFANSRIESAAIPDTVTLIGDYAFTINRLTVLAIPAGVTGIGKGAFTVNQLEAVVIPESVRVIGDEAFTLNVISRITISRNVQLAGTSFDYGFDLYYNAGGKKAGTYLWDGNAWALQK
jgi:hypothetical protein